MEHRHDSFRNSRTCECRIELRKYMWQWYYGEHISLCSFVDDGISTHESNHRSVVAKVINHVAMVRVLNTIKARSWQNELIVAVGSRSYPAKIRKGRPMTMEIRSTKDEIRKSNAHGFDRSVHCDRIKQLRMFPTIPKMKMVDDAYRFNCLVINFNDRISSASVVDVMFGSIHGVSVG